MSIDVSNKRPLEFTKLSPISIFDIQNPYRIKLLARLLVCFSQLNEHKIEHGFTDTINSICICGGDIEPTTHFFLNCSQFNELRQTLFDNIHEPRTNLPCYANIFMVSLNETPTYMHFSSTRPLNLHYLQEDPVDRLRCLNWCLRCLRCFFL